MFELSVNNALHCAAVTISITPQLERLSRTRVLSRTGYQLSCTVGSVKIHIKSIRAKYRYLRAHLLEGVKYMLEEEGAHETM